MKIIRAVGCIFECDHEILVLKRYPDPLGRSLWSLVGGKVNPGESDLSAAVRESWEEIGFSLDPSDLEGPKVFNWDFSQERIDFAVFRLMLDNRIPVNLNRKENVDYMWASPSSCYRMPDLLPGFYPILKELYMR